MGIEQHLMRLQWICAHQECSAVRELRMGRLQLDPFTTNGSPVFAPVELERLARLEHQRHKRAASSCMFYTMPILTPHTGEGGYTCIRSLVTKLHQIRMHLLHCASLFARFACLSQQPCRQTIRVRIKVTCSFGALDFGSTAPSRRYFLIVLRDKPVRRAISRIGISSRNAQRRITLKNPMSITPYLPDQKRQGSGFTWVNSQ